MGAQTRARWKLLLPLCVFTLVVAASPAAGSEDGLEGLYSAGAPSIDGFLEDPHWEGVPVKTLILDGTLSSDQTRAADLRLTHNATHLFFALSYTPGGGTHSGDFVLLTLSDGEDEDLLRYGWERPTMLDDKMWNGTAWVRDAENGCHIDGAAARQDAAGTWHYEVAKPLTGDPCDIDASSVEDLRIRIEFRENRPAPSHGDNFRWPRGSTTSAPAEWAPLRLLAEGDRGSTGGSAPAESASDGASDGTTSGPDDGSVPDGGPATGDGTAAPGGGSEKETVESPAMPVLLLFVALFGPLLRRSRAP